MDALGEKAGHGNDLQLRAHVQTFTGRDRVGDDDLGEHRVVEPLEGGAGKHAVRGTGVHFAGAFAEQDFGSGADRPCRIDNVIHEYRDLAVHIADDVRGGRLVGAVAALVDDGEGRFNALGEGAGAFHAAGVGGNHHDLALHGHEGFEQHLRREQVVHRAIEEPLDLSGMEVHGHHAVRSGGRQEISHELGADGRARADLAVLTGIAVVGDDGGDAARAGALERVEHEAELHQIEVHGRAGRLDDEHVVAADAAADFDAAFAVAELLTQGGGQLAAEMLANGLSQRSVRGAGQNLEITVHRGRPSG